MQEIRKKRWMRKEENLTSLLKYSKIKLMYGNNKKLCKDIIKTFDSKYG